MIELQAIKGAKNYLPQAGFKPGSLSGNLLEFDHNALNSSATTAGLTPILLLIYEKVIINYGLVGLLVNFLTYTLGTTSSKIRSISSAKTFKIEKYFCFVYLAIITLKIVFAGMLNLILSTYSLLLTLILVTQLAYFFRARQHRWECGCFVSGGPGFKSSRFFHAAACLANNEQGLKIGLNSSNATMVTL